MSRLRMQNIAAVTTIAARLTTLDGARGRRTRGADRSGAGKFIGPTLDRLQAARLHPHRYWVSGGRFVFEPPRRNTTSAVAVAHSSPLTVAYDASTSHDV